MNQDPFYEQVAGGHLVEKLEKNIRHAGLVDFADVPGRHEPGTGEIQYENIFRKFAQFKYDRVITMEFIPTADPVRKLRDVREMVLRAVCCGGATCTGDAHS
jgi:hydroxypyruvate isomerase